MFDCLLIANRGEIACRVIRTARRMGIRTVAVYSEVDRNALHVRSADHAICIGPPPAAESYLAVDRIVEAALASGAQAVHPGYGFLSENAEFVDACVAAGLTFVGPGASAIRDMGSKIQAKRLVQEAGTPVVPGYNGDSQDNNLLASAAREIGFPLLIKASAGGGGRGMRRVNAAAEFSAALAAARREALASFADDTMLLERYLENPKHLEVQILADGHGRTLHLFERDCSVQRRHQKVIEEAPAPRVDAQLREALGSAAVKAAQAVDYVGAGTVEFIAEDGEFYFMEMNTRLQVEHPVTEMITGLDLVEWQLRIAAGEPLDFAQEDVVKRGHSVEARLYAENPGNRFLPSTGVLKRLRLPESVRVDSGVVEGDVVSMHYDPMLAKVISSGRDRAEAVANLDAALAELELAGVEHNVGYLRRVLKHPRFASGDYTTHLADDHHEELLPVRGDSGLICAVLALQHADAGGDPWQRADGFRLNLAGGYERQFRRDDEDVCVCLSSSGDAATIAGREIRITDASVDGGRVRVIVDNKDVAAQILIDANDVYVLSGGDTERFGLVSVDTADYEDFSETGERLVSPMPGQVVSVMVIEGQDVLEDQVLMVIEAMKMEHAIKAPHAGRVELLHFAVGDKVDEGVELVTLADVAADTDEQTE